MSPPSTQYQPYAALNDLEGFLVDTEFPRRVAFVEVFREMFGRDVEPQDFAWALGLGRPEVIAGLTERFSDLALLPTVVRDFSVPIGEQILRRRDEIVNPELAKSIDLMPGAPALLAAYGDLNVPSGIITSTQSDVALAMLQAARIPDEFDTIVPGNAPGLARRKPFPDPFLMGASRLAVAPERCWVFGDAPADIQGADAAGMKSIYVPDRRISEPAPRAVKLATYTVDDLFAVADIVRREMA